MHAATDIGGKHLPCQGAAELSHLQLSECREKSPKINYHPQSGGFEDALQRRALREGIP